MQIICKVPKTFLEILKKYTDFLHCTGGNRVAPVTWYICFRQQAIAISGIENSPLEINCFSTFNFTGLELGWVYSNCSSAQWRIEMKSYDYDYN